MDMKTCSVAQWKEQNKFRGSQVQTKIYLRQNIFFLAPLDRNPVHAPEKQAPCSKTFIIKFITAQDFLHLQSELVISED